MGTFPRITENARVIQSDLGVYTELLSYVEFIELSLDEYSYVIDRSSIGILSPELIKRSLLRLCFQSLQKVFLALSTLVNYHYPITAFFILLTF